jgi:hypothetical protein
MSGGVSVPTEGIYGEDHKFASASFGSQNSTNPSRGGARRSKVEAANNQYNSVPSKIRKHVKSKTHS